MSEDSDILKPGQQIKADLDEECAKNLVESRYGFRVKNIVELDAYDDRNYHVICEDFGCENDFEATVEKSGYVLKIINSLDSKKPGFIEAQNELLLFLKKKGVLCPIPVRQKDGSLYSLETLEKSGQRHVLRLLAFIPGEIINKVLITKELLRNFGLFVAQMNKILKDFSHPAYDVQTSLWMLSQVPKLRDFLFALEDKTEIDLVEKIIIDFEQKVLTIEKGLEKGIIHADLNENNLIVTDDGNDIKAVIDFGDSHKNCYIFELAIALCYMITQSKSVDMARSVIEGYQTVRKLPQKEKEILRLCVCARFAQSLVLGTYSYKKEPNNHYLIRAHDAKWTLLKKLLAMSEDEINELWGLNL